MPEGKHWSWYHGPLTGRKCWGCGQALYLRHDGGIVVYGTDRLWHTDCVLDKLPDPYAGSGTIYG